MKDQTVSLYRRISFLVEIIFGLVLVLNGVLLLANYFDLFSYRQGLPNFTGIDALKKWTAYEWKALIEFIHALGAYHLTVFVLLSMGIVIIAAAIHTKRSLSKSDE